MRISFFKKGMIIPVLFSGMMIFSYVFADTMSSSEELVREQILESVNSISGITNSGVTEIVLGESVITHPPEELSTYSGTIDSSGTTQSGSSGVVAPVIVVDYSNYNYYEGLFDQDGVTYGNSLYPKSLNLNPPASVKVYSYDEHMNRSTGLVDKKSNKKSASTSKLSGTMMATALSAPTNGLIAEYLFDGNANDNSPNLYNGTPYMMNWENYNGRYSAKFDGTGSRIEVNNSLLNGVPQFTINTWITWSDISTTYLRGIFGTQGNYYGNIHYQYISSNGTDQLVALYIAGTAPAFEYRNIGIIQKNQWYMLTTTYDQSSKTISYYLNGTLKGSQTFTALPSIAINTTLDIGRVYDNTRYHSGFLDNFRIYSRVLTATEIQDLYYEDAPPPVSNNTSSGYIANYMFNNPLASVDVRYFEQFKGIANDTLIKHTSDEGIVTSIINAAGDPVNLATGEFGYDNTLMKIPGVGLPYELGITYKNQATYNGPIGFNWDHSYNQYLTVEGNGNVLYNNGKLGTFRFIKNGSIFVRNEGLRATLVQSGSLYTISYDNGSKTNFNAINRIASLVDQNNNTLNFNYSGSYLSSVVDTLGRTINYSYYDHNRLKTVTDFTGRKVDFVYYTGATASGNLYDLKDIILTNSGTTKKISFEYSSSSSEPQIHNITKLIDAKGQIYVENTYDTGDRVATQKYGDGTLTYTYTLSGSNITQNTVVDKVGNRSDYTYDINGNHTSIRYYNKAQTGSVIYNYTYNTGGLMLSETRPRGNGYKYGYDANGNLTSKRMKANMSLADSASDIITSYTYNSRNEKLTETLPNGAQVIYTRDGSGNILTKTQSGSMDYNGTLITGITTNYSYYSGGLQKTILTPYGRLTQYYYSSGQLNKIVTNTGVSIISTGTLNYSSYGTILTATDGDGYTKTYEYSPFDLVTKQTTASGIITTYDYDANNNKIRETVFLSGGIPVNSYFYYDSLDHLTGSLVDIAPGQTLLTSYKYDANGNMIEKKIGNGALTKYKYNEFSKITEERIIMVPGDSTKDIVTTYIYDTNNNLTIKTDPRGYTTNYAYDLYDRIIQETNPEGTYTSYTLNKDNTIDTKSVYTNTGFILTKNKSIYDNYGHITKSTDYLIPSTNTGAVSKRYVYTKDFDINFVYHDDTSNNRTQYYYDIISFNRVFTYDAMNNASIETYNRRNLKTEEWRSSLSGYTLPVTTYIYDGDGRMIRSMDNLGKYKSYVYNNLGFVTKITDEVGRVTDITRDYRGLMLTSTSYSGATAITTTYTYDDRGNMTSITDPMNRTTSYQYDGINRNTKIIYPDLKEMNYTYDKNSNFLTKTDPNGTVVTNTYNSLNQLTNRSISLGVGVGGATSESYSYDQLGRMMSGSNNIPLSYSFTYDTLSRVKTETQKQLPGMSVGYVLQYNYSSVGDLTGITLPDGKIQTITYDLLHRPLVTTHNGQTIATNAYNRFFLTGTTYGNGRTINYTYDTINRINAINHGTGVTNPSYIYNDASDILTDGTKSYAYDGLARLITASPVASGTTGESYSYDKSGNRIINSLGTGGINYTTNSLDQYTLLTGSILSGSLTYDNNGNIKTIGNRSYTYDYNNRLIQVNSGATILVTYQYDNLGRRAIKTDYTKPVGLEDMTLYTYNGDNLQTEAKIIKFLNGSGQVVSMTLTKHYINGIGTDNLIAHDAVEQTSSTGTTTTTNRYYYHTNQLGSVVALSSSTGVVLQKYIYDSFGKAYVYSGSTLVPISTYTGTIYSNTRLYTGREFDKESNLYYNRARYYNPDTGRFLSRDPIGQNDQVNLYTYVRNSPLMYTDRDGKKASALIAPVWKYTKDFIGNEIGYVGAGLYHLADGVSFGYLDDYTGFQDQISSQNYSSTQRGIAPGFNRGWKDGNEAAYLLDIAVVGYAGVQMATKYAYAQSINSIKIETSQLMKKYKHAGDFGLDPKKSNPDNWNNFKSAINDHIANPDTQVIPGTYRGNNVTHYFNSNTNNNVLVDSNRSFISGWKLNSDQIKNLFSKGGL